MEQYKLINFYKKFLITETETKNNEKVPIGIIKFKKRNGRYCVAEFKCSELPDDLINESRKLSKQYIENTLKKELEYMTFFEDIDINLIEYFRLKGLTTDNKIMINKDIVEKLILDKYALFDNLFEIEYKIFSTGIYVQMVICEKFWKEFLLNDILVDPRVFYYATFDDNKNKFDLCVKIGIIREKDNGYAQSLLPVKYNSELLVEQLKLCSIEYSITQADKPLTKEQLKNKEIPEKFTVVMMKLLESNKYKTEKYLQLFKNADGNIIKKFNCVRLHYEF
jgi:hypothetical protein